MNSDTNLTISSEKLGDINKFTIDLCSNLDLSSIRLDSKLQIMNEAYIEFYNAIDDKNVIIDISTGLQESYKLQLPFEGPNTAITNGSEIIASNKAFITVDNSGVMEFKSLQVLLDSVRTGINAREQVKYITIDDPSNNLNTSTDPSYLIFISGEHKIGNLSSISDFSYGDRILINNQDTHIWNGIYTISGESGQPITGTSFELHRSSDFNSSGEANNAFVFVTDGSFANTGWIVKQTSSTEIRIGSDQINFVQFTGEQNLDINVDPNKNIIKTLTTPNDITFSLNSNITEISSILFNTTGEIKFLTNDSNGGDDNTLSLKAPTFTDASYTLTLPQHLESSGAYMRVDGSGNLYFEDISLHDISLISNNPNLIIDTSLIDSTTKQFNLDLCDNLVLEKLTISNELIVAKDASLVFYTRDGSSISVKAPTDASAYTLTLPETIGISGEGHKYLTTDQSGNLSFVDISNIQTDISLVSKHTNLIIDASDLGADISGFIFDLCDNLIVENLTISGGELKINHDSSLVFGIEDGSSITIVAPSGISNEYILTLPSDLSGGGYLTADASGHLKFDQQITSTNFILTNNNNILNDTTKIINYNHSTLEQQVIYNINRQLLKEGLPIIYYLPLMTFNSDRESTIDQSFSYYDYDTKEYQLVKSSITYINERNLMHAINYNCKYMLNYTSVQNILTNYIDAINGFLEIPFINIMANDFYLKVLNIATIANKYYKTSSISDNFFSNNQNLIKFLKHLKNFKNIYDTSFNETACILPSNLNPPYYFDISSSNSIKINYDNSWNKSSELDLDGSYNPLLIFGDIEYEQNFIAIKNALDNKKYTY